MPIDTILKDNRQTYDIATVVINRDYRTSNQLNATLKITRELHRNTAAFGKICRIIFDKSKTSMNKLNHTIQDNNSIRYLINKIYSEQSTELSIHSVACGLIAGGYSRVHRVPDLLEGAYFHDIGKTQLPKSVLQSPIELKCQEWEEMCQHPQLGYELLTELNYKTSVSQMALEHHISPQASGYPDLHDKPSEMSMIVSAIDVLSACMEKRTYKESWPLSKAMNILCDKANIGELSNTAAYNVWQLMFDYSCNTSIQ